MKDIKKDDLNENATSDTNGNNMPARKNRANVYRSAAYLAKIAILSALGFVLLVIEFPIFPATPYLQLNVSDLPTLLASFMFGPISGIIVNALKTALGLLRSTSGGIGELSNLISGTIYAFSAGVIYKLKKDKTGAIIALIAGSTVFIVSMLLCNALILLPAYGITDGAMKPLLLWTALFNLIKTGLTSALTFFLYKKTHALFGKF